MQACNAYTHKVKLCSCIQSNLSLISALRVDKEYCFSRLGGALAKFGELGFSKRFSIQIAVSQKQ